MGFFKEVKNLIYNFCLVFEIRKANKGTKEKKILHFQPIKGIILWCLLFSITQNEPWYIQYGWALFKTLSHMLCIGYGRYIPALLDEALLTIFSMVTGATFYALFIAHSMAFIIRRDSSKTTYQEKVSGIPKELNFYVKARAI